MKDNKDSDSDGDSNQDSDSDMSDAEIVETSVKPKHKFDRPKSYIQEILAKSVLEEEDEKKIFLRDTLGIIGKEDDEESKDNAIGDELDSLFSKKKVKKPLIK